MITSFTAVLDTCALFPALLRDALLSAAEAELFRPAFTRDILNELERNLVEKIGVEASKAARLKMRVESAFAEHIVRGYDDLVPAMTNDDGDRHVLAAAVRCSAQIIVTFNLRHFPADATSKYGVQAVHPDEFLSDLLAMECDLMLRAMLRLLGRLNDPRLTPLEFSKSLGKNCPQFAAGLLLYLEGESLYRPPSAITPDPNH